jgi:PAS domain S-box-containing protein
LRERTKALQQQVEEQMVQIRLQAETMAHLGEGVVITDGPNWMKSRIVFINEAVSRITGYTAGELIGRQRSILNGSGTDRQTLSRIRLELAAGKSSQAELVQYRKDGTPYYAELSITPLKREGQHFVSIHRDITGRKIAEQAIRESEQRFRQLVDDVPVMIWMSGLDKLCTFCNRPSLDFTGRTLEHEVGNGWMDGVHPEDQARCFGTYTTAFEGRLPFTMECRVRRHDGQWRWLITSGTPLYEGNRVFKGYIGTCIDVTERRQGDEALRASEERMRTILHTVSDSIITTDQRGIIIAVNPATERMFGYTRNELVGRQVKLLIPPSGHVEHDGDLARYFETGKAGIIGFSRETRGLRKDGSTFPVELAVSEIPQLRLFTGILRDISARKQTEKALERYRKDLKTMSSELLLAEERERQRLAQDLHDGLGQALFRARMKLDQLPGENPIVLELDAILQEVAKVVNTLTFELSPPMLRQLGLRPAIRRLVWDMKQRYGLSVQVAGNNDEDYPLDERVALVLFRSLRELLINVAKHAKTDQASVLLGKSDNHLLQIKVKDQGKGFDPADQERQVQSGHFGLFSVRERLEYFGGTLDVQSAPGKGTRVTLTVPLAKAKATTRRGSASP